MMTMTAQIEITSNSLRSLHQRRSCPSTTAATADSPQAGKNVIGGRSSVPSKLLLVSGDNDNNTAAVMAGGSVVGEVSKNRGKFIRICSLFLVIVTTISSVVTFYKLGRHLATIVPFNDGVSSTTAENNDAPFTTSSSSSTSSSRMVINTANMSKLDQSLLPLLAESTPFIRGLVINTIMERFTARNPLTTSRVDRLADAFDAMEYLEEDGEAIQVSGHPFLFVGSIGAAVNYKTIQENKITHVINWSSSAQCNAFNNIEYMCITGISGRFGMLHDLAQLDKAVEFVEAARKSGGRVLSHCWHGRNRSVTTLVAYLMKYEGMTAKQANNLIKQTRPQADPYFDVLAAWSKQYLKRNKVDEDNNNTSSEKTAHVRTKYYDDTKH